MNKIVNLHQHYFFLSKIRIGMYKKTDFKPIPERISFPDEEQTTLKYWDEKQCFQKQLELTKDLPPYTFYDGPPFATGTPHYGHIAAGTIKDVVCRYASQTGHFVSRRFGWDCHGLPVEYQIDKDLGIKDKSQVTQMGIAKYNEACRSIVMKYSGEWESIIGRFGRWIDFKNDYKTLDIKFMESVWYMFKQLFNKDLVYRGRKIMPYSNACTTVLSNFEVQLNYKDVSDPSLYVNFPTVNDPKVKFMVWTTTPWTLPSNLALAVKGQMDYVKIKDIKRDEIFIMAECRLKHFYGKDKKAYEIIEKMKGTDLEGIEYEPMFDFFINRKKDGCFRVQVAAFVTDDSGTGIVHCAPGFGEEDYKMCVQKKIIHPDDPPVPLDANGKFTDEIPPYQGIMVKDSDKIITKDLKDRGRIVQSGMEVHSYPYCWRSDTPLIYKAVSTWFIKVTDFKDKLVANNHKAEWVPKVIQEKRFNNWLKDAKDWCFSRNRYWGNPIPIWISDDGEEIVCIGSVKELEELTGTKVTDLHREHIDHLTIESKQGKGKLRRIEEVFDCWFESGSMPYAQVHYPFSITEEEFSKIYPADFIGEGIDQTRGWFYTLNVIATGVRDMNPYKNLIVNGLVLTEDGKKMSKRLKNYPDPVKVADEFGADAVRLYLINSPLVRADNLCFAKSGVKAVVREIFLPWYNAYRFLIQNIGKWELKNNEPFVFQENIEDLFGDFNVTDRWIQSALQSLIKNVRKEMIQYKLYNVVPELIKFLENLTNWYVRLNRPRLKGDIDDLSMRVSLNVLFDVLFKVNVLMSPHVPFLTEHMFQNMRLVIAPQSKLNQDSIHHVMIADFNEKLFDEKINREMTDVMSIIETARKLREHKKISLKQPIMLLTVVNKSQAVFDDMKPFLSYIEEEINVAELKNEIQTQKYIKFEALPNLPSLGPKFKGNKDFKKITDEIKKLSHQAIEQCKEDGFVTILENKIAKDDIIIKQKFLQENVLEHEAIGGDRIIVLLDTRQNEELRIKGFARQITNRIQKLKKKTHLKTEDSILIFFKLEEGSVNLAAAFDKEYKTICNAVKKPLLAFEKMRDLTVLSSEKGVIDEESFQIFITVPGAVLNKEALEVVISQCKAQFKENSSLLGQCLLTKPYNSYKDQNSVHIRLNGKDYELVKSKHYQILI